MSHTITYLGRSGSAEGTGLVNLCCSWRKTTGILGRRSGSGVCSMKRRGQGPRGDHILAAGTLQRPDGHFSHGPGSNSNWNCTPFSTGFPSGPSIDPDTWSWSHLASPGHLSIQRGGGRHQGMKEELSSHFLFCISFSLPRLSHSLRLLPTFFSSLLESLAQAVFKCHA